MKYNSSIIYRAGLFKPPELVDTGLISGEKISKLVHKDTKNVNASAGQAGKKPLVITGRDGKQVSRLARRAVVAGLTAYGVDVIDLRLVPDPVVEWIADKASADLCFYFFFEAGDMYIKAFSSPEHSNILNAIQSSIESLETNRPDNKGFSDNPSTPSSPQAHPDKSTIKSFSFETLGNISYEPNAVNNYLADFSKQIAALKGTRKIRRTGRKRLLFDCMHSAMPMIMETLSNGLDIEIEVLNGGVVGSYELATEDEFLYKLKNSTPPFAAGIRVSPKDYRIFRSEKDWADEAFPSFDAMLPHLVKLVI